MTACDLEKSYSIGTSVDIRATYTLRFIYKRILVNICFIFLDITVWELQMLQTAKVTLLYWHHSIGQMIFCTISKMLSLRLCDPQQTHIGDYFVMCTLALCMINIRTKCEMVNFACSEDRTVLQKFIQNALQ